MLQTVLPYFAIKFVPSNRSKMLQTVLPYFAIKFVPSNWSEMLQTVLPYFAIKEGAWRSQRPLGRTAVLSQSQVLKDYFVSNTAQGNRNYILRQCSP